jgi:hypothetical protein
MVIIQNKPLIPKGNYFKSLMEVNIKHFFIYFLVDPRSDEIRYVGLTQFPHSRLSQHLKDKTYSPKRTWLLELRKARVLPEMKVIEVTYNRSEGEARELWWIETLLGKGCKLTNTTKTAPVKQRMKKEALPRRVVNAPKTKTNKTPEEQERKRKEALMALAKTMIREYANEASFDLMAFNSICETDMHALRIQMEKDGEI